MSGKDSIKLGYKPGPAIGVALRLISIGEKALSRKQLKVELKAVLADPIANSSHPYFAELAAALREQEAMAATFVDRSEPAPYQVWGENLEPSALDQMKAAVRLPVSVSGALMPDAHVGYGLPI